MDAREAAKFIINSFGVGRILMLGEETIPVARVLMRNGVDVVCLVQDECSISRVSSLCSGRFISGCFSDLPFLDGEFSVVIAPSCIDPEKMDRENERVIEELARVVTRWFVIGRRCEAHKAYPSPHYVHELVVRKRNFRICLDRSTESLEAFWGGQGAVFEKTGKKQREFSGEMSDSNLLFPKTSRAVEMGQLARILGRKLSLKRIGVEKIVWEDEELWHVGAAFKMFSGVQSVYVKVPSADALEEAREIYGVKFPGSTFGDSIPEQSEISEGVCRVVRWGVALDLKPFSSAFLIRCQSEEVCTVLEWADAHGYKLRQVLAEIYSASVKSFYQCTLKDSRDVVGIVEELRNSGEVFFLFSSADFVEPLVDLSFGLFREIFGSPFKRPLLYLSEMESLCQKVSGTFPVNGGEEQAAYKRCSASLAYAYGILSYSAATIDMNEAASSFLRACCKELKLLPELPETERWLISALRALAVLSLDRGDREMAEGFFKLCLKHDSRAVHPHLRRHALDSHYFLGLMAFSNGNEDEALSLWGGASDVFLGMVDDLKDQGFSEEFHYGESGNLFFVARMCLQARRLVSSGRSPHGGWPLDSGLAVASVVRSVDRYGDESAASVDFLRPI